MSDTFDFSFLPAGDRSTPQRRQRSTCRIVVMGDFGGREVRGLTTTRTPVLREIDFDSFDATMQQIGAGARLPFGNEHIELACPDLDAFHPDELLQKVPSLVELMRQRDALRDPTRARAVLDQLTRSDSKPTPAAENDASMFERLLGTRQRDTDSQFDRWLATVVEPFVSPAPDPRATDLVQSVESAIAVLLREALHHPEFRALESAWTGVHWLLQGLELDEHLRVDLLDITVTELRDASATNELTANPLHSVLVGEPAANADPIALAIPLADFTTTAEDLRTLAMLGALGQQGGFAVVATAAPGFGTLVAQGENESARWQALRDSPQAGSLGLVTPRIVLRLPYGKRTSPLDEVDFEEIPDPPQSDGYLLGAGGLAVARMVGAAFAESTWPFARFAGAIDGMPLHTFRKDGVATAQPCTAELLTDSSATTLNAAGIMGLLGATNRDAVQLQQLRSIASGAPALAGPWAG